MDKSLELEMPDVAHHSLKLDGRFVGAGIREAGRNFPPALWHLFCKRFELFVDFLRGGEGVSRIALVAGEYQAGDLAEALVVEGFC